MIFHVFAAGGLLIALYDVSGLGPSISWYAIFVFIAAMRFVLLLFYKKVKDLRESYKTWRLLYIIGAVATGLAWGGGGVYLFPQDAVPQQLLHAFIIGVMVMGAVPIIAMTANARQCDQRRCLAAGMSDYLCKPIDRDRLAMLLSKWRQLPN